MFHSFFLRVMTRIIMVLAWPLAVCADGVSDSSTERFRVRIHNQVSGSVMVSLTHGATWYPIGQVLIPNAGAIHTVKEGEFSAVKWAPTSSVAATAVNAIHLKLTHTGTHGELISILPKEVMAWREAGISYAGEPSSVYLDLAAGTGLFGLDWSLRVGDPVYLKDGAQWVAWPEGRVPQLNDEWMIIAKDAGLKNWVIEIENHVAGRVTLYQPNQPPHVLARVMKPVSGSGRFPGSLYQSIGRIRANHPGVIDVSTSPLGQVGGFQIVPNQHGQSNQLRFTMISPVYMVIQPLEGAPPLEGQWPLFKGMIQPGDEVDAMVNGTWQPMPESIGKDYTRLSVLEGIRIRPGPHSNAWAPPFDTHSPHP